MAKNMKAKEFLNVIIETLSREFEKEVKVENIDEDEIIIFMDKYQIRTSMSYLEDIKSPYGIDRFILQSFEKEGFAFNINRSQYVQYCFGVYSEEK